MGKRLFLRWDFTPVALVPVAAFAVHQLRYLLAFGGHAGTELQLQGHSYMHSLVPWIVVSVALAAGVFLRAVGRAFGGQVSLPRYTVSFVVLWLICAGSLLAIYACQELLEGLIATGHPAGLVGVFGYGGGWSVLAALCVGLVLATVFQGARWVLREMTRRYVSRRGWRARRNGPRPRPDDVFVPALPPLAGGWSGRGPPSDR
jgi:hypothetical protein